MINNSQVNLHLFDSGLLKIPFELCVDRNISDSIFLNDITDQPAEIKIDEMVFKVISKKIFMQYTLTFYLIYLRGCHSTLSTQECP